MPLIGSQRAPLLVGVAFVFPLLVYAYVGSFARYVADDFCTASMVMQRGLLGAQQYWYVNWSGRFAFVLMIDVLNSLGAWTVPATPAVLLLAWVGVATVAVQEVRAGRAAALDWATSAVLAMVLVGATLAAAPGLWQSLYWQTGAVTYLVPVVLMTCLIGVVAYLRRPGLSIRARIALSLLSAMLAIAVVGCSETSMGLLVGGLSGGTAAVAIFDRGPDRRTLLMPLSVALAASLLASVVVIAAPGNAVRGDPVLRAGLASSISSLVFPMYVLLGLIIAAPAYTALAFLVGLVVGSMDAGCAKPVSRAALVLTACGCLAVAAAGAPAFFATGGLPPQRAMIVPQATLLGSLMALGYLQGQARGRLPVWSSAAVKKGIAATCAVVLLTAGPVQSGLGALSARDELAAYAAALDGTQALAQTAAANGQPSTLIPHVAQPTMVNLDEIGPDPTAAPNRCMAAYFGLQSIATR